MAGKQKFGDSKFAQWMTLLIDNQNIIIHDVTQNKKTHHWIWYVFPTTKSGRSDPKHFTMSNEEKRTILSTDFPEELKERFVSNWSRMIDVMCAIDPRSFITDTDDFGRIKYFCDEWTEVLNTTENQNEFISSIMFDKISLLYQTYVKVYDEILKTQPSARNPPIQKQKHGQIQKRFSSRGHASHTEEIRTMSYWRVYDKNVAIDIEVNIIKGDVRNSDCYAIVNAANSSLNHSSGIAKIIADAAGDGLRAASMEKQSVEVGTCYVTDSFDLKEKGNKCISKIIHAVAPVYDPKREVECIIELQSVVIDIMTKTSHEKFTSVELCALGTGNFKWPSEIAIPIIVEQVYLKIRDKPALFASLKRICFRDFDIDKYTLLRSFALNYSLSSCMNVNTSVLLTRHQSPLYTKKHTQVEVHQNKDQGCVGVAAQLFEFKCGIVIAGNSGRPGGAVGPRYNEFDIHEEKIHANHKTQEEDVVSAWLSSYRKYDKNPNDIFYKTLFKTFGVSDDRSKTTLQGINFTNAKEFAYYDSYCVEYAPLQLKKGVANEKHFFGDIPVYADLYFVAGPNANVNHGVSTKFTYNLKAKNYVYYKNCLYNAIASAIDHMISKQCKCALIPKIGCGIYADVSFKKRISDEFVDLVKTVMSHCPGSFILNGSIKKKAEIPRKHARLEYFERCIVVTI